MTNGVPQQIISFLSGFKTFFFYALTFLIFGAAFLFLSQSLCEQGWLCNNYLKPISSSIEIDFSRLVDGVKFLVFSYIVGLLLYTFSRLIFSKSLRGFLSQRLQKAKTEEKNNEKRPNDIDILNYLEGHELSKDVYVMQLFYSLTTRLLFGFVAFATILFSPELSLFGIITTVALFLINLSADNEVNNLGNQIKDVIREWREIRRRKPQQ